MSDLKIMVLTFTAEYMGIDSEHQFFRTLPTNFHSIIKSYILYVYKLYAVCTAKGVFRSPYITPASVHDLHYLKTLKPSLKTAHFREIKVTYQQHTN